MSTYPRPPIDAAEREACDHDGPDCYAVGFDGDLKFHCTRTADHDGDHIAAGLSCICYRWTSPTAPDAPSLTDPHAEALRHATASACVDARATREQGEQWAALLAEYDAAKGTP